MNLNLEVICSVIHENLFNFQNRLHPFLVGAIQYHNLSMLGKKKIHLNLQASLSNFFL